MIPVNIAVVDDLPEERERVRVCLENYKKNSKIAINTEFFGNAEDFLKDYRPYKYTLIFMDIYMGQCDGITAAKYVREHDTDVIIIFLTTSRDHMPEAFSIHAYDYLAKPVDESRIHRLMDGIMEKYSKALRELEIPCDGKKRTVKYSDIILICAEGHSVKIHDRKENVYITHRRFFSIEKDLENDRSFLKINRGIIVNMDNIADISAGECRLSDGSTIPISIRSKKQIEQTYANYMFSKILTDTVRRGSI